MMDVAPLLLLLAISKRSSSADAPAWPTSASPPPMPPMPPPPPSLSPLPSATTPHADANSGAPLSELLKQADVVHHAAQTAKKAVAKAIPKKLSAKSLAASMPGAIFIAPNSGKVTLFNVSVADLQTALIKRGVKLTKDGLYGPKTAAAWQAAAKQKRLPTAIARVGPKIARVAKQTFQVLSVPAIP